MNAITSPLHFERIAGALGAEIHGVDLLGGVSDATVAEIRRIWLEHCVVFFRGQPLSPATFAAFARRFGEVVHYPYLPGLDEAPEVIVVEKLAHQRINFGGTWHIDTTYLDVPPMATMLIAREMPPQGGDTCFASGYAAYDALSEGMRRMLAPLRVVNSSLKAERTRTREDGKAAGSSRVFEAEHPLIRRHPETGRQSLYLSFSHAVRFAGMTEAESAGLLEYLFAHQARMEFTCRFRWDVGSIAFWDNRCALHFPVNDYDGHRRVMHRVTLAGDTPV